jgi:hypothetical protein
MLPGEVSTELFAKHRLASDQLDAMFGIEFSEGQQRAGDGSGRGIIAPHSIERDARQGSPFPRCDPLLAGVIAALTADAVGSLG